MKLHTQAPLVVEGKLSDSERMKKESHFLRGTITEDLQNGLTGGFEGDNFLLIRFHGMYQQDDRDIRAERAQQMLEPRHAMMLRCRLPGGIISLNSGLALISLRQKIRFMAVFELLIAKLFNFMAS